MNGKKAHTNRELCERQLIHAPITSAVISSPANVLFETDLDRSAVPIQTPVLAADDKLWR